MATTVATPKTSRRAGPRAPKGAARAAENGRAASPASSAASPAPRAASPASPSSTAGEPERGAEKRDAILGAALALFSERGFYGTAVPEIAQRAGVAAGTIYRHFESKEALVNALYQQHKETLAMALMDGFDPSAPPRTAFQRFWRNAITFAQRSPQTIAFLELHHHAPYLDDRSRHAESFLFGVARGFLERSESLEVFKPLNAEILIAIVWGAFRGVVQAAIEGRLVLDEAVIAHAEQCVWEAVRR